MKFRILVTTVLLVIGWTLIAQSTFRSSEAGTHGDCAALENQMKGLDAARARLQKDLQKATGSDRQSLIQQIKELDSQMQQKQTELNQNRCKGVIDVDSKHLVVHGPYKYPPDNSNVRPALGPRLGRSNEGDRDDFEAKPGKPCDDQARCPGTQPPRSNAIPDSPPPRASWIWDSSIGAGDPQIAAGQDCLLVSAYQHIAYLSKSDGQFLPVKQPPAFGAQPGGGRKTTQQSKLGQAPRTAPIFTNDLFAPMLDDINATLNLTPEQKKACQQANFDCNINNFYDTRVVYDEYRNRFWVVSLAIAVGIQAEDAVVLSARREKLAVAVSISPDPRDGWNLYWCDAVPNDGHWPLSESSIEHGADYPSVGISPKYLIEEHSAGAAGSSSANVSIIEADPLARGERPNVQLKAFEFWNFKDPNGDIVTSIIQPAIHHGSAPALFAAVLANTFSEGNESSLMLYYFNDVLGKFSRVQVPILEFFGPRAAPQRPSASVPDPFTLQMTNTGNSVMKAAFGNGRVYATFNDCRSFGGSRDCTTSVRLVRVRIGNPNVMEVDQSIGGRSANEPASVGNVFFGMPAVEVNRSGDAAVVYTRSGEHVFPQAAYSVLFHDADGISSGRTLQPGTGALGGENSECVKAKEQCGQSTTSACKQKIADACKPTRDLDVAGISVDPGDDSIWIANGYAEGSSWRIAVGQILGRKSAHRVKK